jgi:hypothetical protein
LIPDAFLTGAFYEKLRVWLLDNCHIVSLSELPANTIAGATVGHWCIAHYRKEKGSRDAEQVDLFRVAGEDKIKDVHFRLPLKSLVSPDKSRFQLIFNEFDLSIVESLKQLAPMSSVLRGHTGIRSRIGQANIVATDFPGGSSWQAGLVSGSQVSRHAIDWQGHYLNTDRDNLFAGGHDASIIKSAKILVRQTGDRPIAALDRRGFYHLNNIHSFAPAKNVAGADLSFLAGLINSSFWLYLYQLKSREAGRVLAQIDIEMLESMPLPASMQFVPMVAALVEHRLNRAEDADSRHLAAKFDRAIDRVVYEMYNMSNEQIAYIEGLLPVTGVQHRLPVRDEVFRLFDSLENPLMAARS